MLPQTKAPMLTRDGRVVYIDPTRHFEAVVTMNEMLVTGIRSFIEQGQDGHVKEYFRDLLRRSESLVDYN